MHYMNNVYNNFKSKILTIFTYGLTPYQLALTVSLGVTFGLFPFIGVTSILCFVFAFIFRLNVVVIQLVNWIVAPLQLLMLVPFYQLGQFVNTFFTDTKTKTIEKVAALKESFFDYFFNILNSQLSAIIGWAFICIPFALTVHFASLFFYKKHLNKKASRTIV